MSLHNDFHAFLLSLSSVTAPIIDSIPGSDPQTPAVVSRVTYGNATQERFLPRLSFMGPFDYDAGNTSDGPVEEKLGHIWIAVYCSHLTDAMDWITAIENEIASLFVNNYFAALTTTRIMCMLLVDNSKRPVANDQVSQTSQEKPPSAATLCYNVAWQNATT